MSKQNVDPITPQLPPKALVSLSSESNTKFKQAQHHYHVGEYRKAIELFEHLDSEDEEEREYIKLYKANAYLADNDIGKSKELYKEIIEKGKYFTAESKLNLASNFLKEGNADDAMSCLNDLKGTHCERNAEDLIKSINT